MIMTMEDYVNDIRMQLGGSMVEIENESDIASIVRLSLRELTNYYTDIRTVTIPYASKIDFTELNKVRAQNGKDPINIANIHYLMRAKNQFAGFTGYSDIVAIYRPGSATSSGIDSFSRSFLLQQAKAALGTDLDFHYEKQDKILYIYAHQSHPQSITLVYTPEINDITDITEPFWQNLLLRLALAHTKEVLGRIRSKYSLNGATYSLDGNTLLSEAQSELSAIREYLDRNTDMVLPID